MNEHSRKTIPDQLMDALAEVESLRAELQEARRAPAEMRNPPTKTISAQLAEALSQIETLRAENVALRAAVNQPVGQSADGKPTPTTPSATKQDICAITTPQTEIRRMESEVETKRANLLAARLKNDLAQVASLEGELAASRKSLVALRTNVSHAQADAALASTIRQHAEAGTLRSGYARDEDQIRQDNMIAATSSRLKAAGTLNAAIAEGYREKLGIT